MKKQLLSLVLVAAFTGNAYASDVKEVTLLPGIVASAQTQAVDVTPALNSLDIQAAFQQDKQPMQVASLSGQEMKATEGAWGWASLIISVAQGANKYWAGHTGSAHDQSVSNGLANALKVASAIAYFF
jgi:hypothetical protein